ncbi:hypothetical protein SUGI_0852840 [Cryptomeria japonica]|uniref:probable mediator of RNA polymerase II transcription subunit 26b n=1 Tax=Cryptomeria japonica TaxID=3369 RepID=UPI002414CA86|nr:probable mediator of RNA polymerase II transcription subunit 26b [Cryptomeria japonica]GLJ41200.1 hypothetical protein SUGI_0852840 [Cryptomeria japonica]
MESWRKFFLGAGTDICTVIENAIAVAASDWPQELRERRDRIAQRLFYCGFVRCGQCSELNLAGPDSGDNTKGALVLPRCEGQQNHAEGSSDDGRTRSSKEFVRNGASNYSFDEAEALTEQIEEESEILREVERIKEILLNPEESGNQVNESLRILELMQISVGTLEVTGIGKVVSRLKRHHSEQVRSMAKMLVSGWKELVDDMWMKTAATLGPSHESVCREEDIRDGEHGLPSPPLDKGAFLTTHTGPIEMSELFAEMDDDGNPHIIHGNDYNRKQIDEHGTHCGDDDKQHYSGKQSVQQKYRKREGDGTAKKLVLARNKEQWKITSVGKSWGTPKPNDHRDRLTGSPKHQMSPSNDVSDNVCVRAEAAKRKFGEGYQVVDKTKKRRTVQLIGLQDLPENSRHRL